MQRLPAVIAAAALIALPPGAALAGESARSPAAEGPQSPAESTLRTWRVTPPQALRARIGTPTIEGRLVEVRGFDAEHSLRVAIIERVNGSRLSIVTRWLDRESQAVVDRFPDARAERRERRAAEPPLGLRPGEYPVPRPEGETDGIERAATEHFHFHWGTKRDGSGAAWFAPGFRERTLLAFEDARDFYRDVLKAPLPGRGDERMSKRAPEVFGKTNVYITGTGLPRHEEGFAFAALDIIMHPAALAPGSSVIPHEFAHCVQLASGGFRNSEFVGWFWENHAEWCTHQYFPGHAPAFWAWLERRHYELNSSRMNYGSWMWLQVMSESQDLAGGLGPDFIFDLWESNRLDEHGRSIEDPIQTCLRLLAERPAVGSPAAAAEVLGTIIGRVAERSAFWTDLEHGFTYAASEAEYEVHSRGALRHRATLLPLGTADATDFVIPYSQAPRDYGLNIIDLALDEDAPAIVVGLTGIASAAVGPDASAAPLWRAALLIERADRSIEVARTTLSATSGGQISLERFAGDRRARLAVAATPVDWTPIEFRPGYGAKRRFPFLASIEGAAPATSFARSEQSGAADPSNLIRVPNGGGLRAPSATVADTAFVAEGAMVLGDATVEGNARILGNAVVRDRAIVRGNAVVRDTATVRDEATVEGDALVAGGAIVAGRVRVGERARVLEAIHLDGDGSFAGDALAKGWGEIHTNAAHTIGGWAWFGEDCEVHMPGNPQELAPMVVDRGRIYGFMAPDQWRETQRAADPATTLAADWIPTRATTAAGTLAERRHLLDSLGDHPLLLPSGTTITAEGAVDLRSARAAAITEGTPFASAGWTLEATLLPAAEANAQVASIIALHWEDGRGNAHALHLRFVPGATPSEDVFVVELTNPAGAGPESREPTTSRQVRLPLASPGARTTSETPVALTLRMSDDGVLHLASKPLSGAAHRSGGSGSGSGSGGSGEATLSTSIGEPWSQAFPLRCELGAARFERLRVERSATPR